MDRYKSILSLVASGFSSVESQTAQMCTHTSWEQQRNRESHCSNRGHGEGWVQFAEQPPDGAVRQVSFEVLTACRWHFKRKSSQRPRKGHCFISHFPKPVDWIGVLPGSILASRSYVWQPWDRLDGPACQGTFCRVVHGWPWVHRNGWGEEKRATTSFQHKY